MKRVIQIGIVGVLALLVARELWVTARWQEFEEKLASVRATLDERQAEPRDVLVGVPEPGGSAWADYQRAAGLLSESGLDVEAIIPAYQAAMGIRDESLSEHDELIGRGAEALALMERGARREDHGRSIDWEAGFDHSVASLLAHRNLANLAVVSATRAIEQGEEQRAVETLLAALQMSGDLQRSPLLIDAMIGVAIQAIVVEAMAGAEGARLIDRLGEPRLQVLATALDRHVSQTPLVGNAVRAEATIVVNEIARRGSIEGFDLGVGGWRFLFSSRLHWKSHLDHMLALDAFRESLVRDVAVVDRDALAKMDTWVARHERALVPGAVSSLSSAWRARLESFDRVLLLRAAIDLRLGAPLEEHRDVHGQALTLERISDEESALAVTARPEQRLLAKHAR